MYNIKKLHGFNQKYNIHFTSLARQMTLTLLIVCLLTPYIPLTIFANSLGLFILIYFLEGINFNRKNIFLFCLLILSNLFILSLFIFHTRYLKFPLSTYFGFNEIRIMVLGKIFLLIFYFILSENIININMLKISKEALYFILHLAYFNLTSSTEISLFLDMTLNIFITQYKVLINLVFNDSKLSKIVFLINSMIICLIFIFIGLFSHINTIKSEQLN
ncbi:hypothetical protein H311_02217 [Anncaliia algerae PRA109]|nr:hypothetical protein H311_02217 [Anncaliia algerae PRA109]